MSELVELARAGDDRSLFTLVSLDRTFLTSRFLQKRIFQAQGMEDTRFFAHLAKSLKTDLYRERQIEVKVGIACYLLWFLGYNRLPRTELFQLLKSQRLISYEDPQSFYRMLNRIGLKKYRRT
jgi:hypothetical protein